MAATACRLHFLLLLLLLAQEARVDGRVAKETRPGRFLHQDGGAVDRAQGSSSVAVGVGGGVAAAAAAGGNCFRVVQQRDRQKEEKGSAIKMSKRWGRKGAEKWGDGGTSSAEEDPAFSGSSHSSIVLGSIADHVALQSTVPLQDLWEGVRQ